MSDRTPPPAGWYDDPSLVNTRRYWDGQRWTEHRQEQPAPTRTVRAEAAEPRPSGWITAGYLFGVFFPIVGLVIGIGRLGVEPKWAWKVIAISIGAFVVYGLLYLYNVA